MDSRVKRNSLGYYELVDKPSQEELEEYYRAYYQNTKGAYENAYTDEEIAYVKNKIAQKYLTICQRLPKNNKQGHSLLDVGAGEGWALAYFKDRGWSVTGLDYNNYGCQKFNPKISKHLRTGDVYKGLVKLKAEGTKFSVIWLNNVLEHVLDPKTLLIELKDLMERKGILMIQVPNDFSVLQDHLIKQGHIEEPFWVVSPDHISYFTPDSLTRFCEKVGWKKITLIGDYPIDLNLINPNTNYAKDKTRGKSCHSARVEIENLLHKISPEKTITLYTALADLGLGRDITGYFMVKGK